MGKNSILKHNIWKLCLLCFMALSIASCQNRLSTFGNAGSTGAQTPQADGPVPGQQVPGQVPNLAAQATGPVKVAILLPLSARGEAGRIAKSLKEAGELALFDTNDPGIVLIPKDTRGTAGGARAAAEQALAEGAQVILGPLFGSSVRAVAPLAQARGVPVIAFSTDRTVAGNNVYLLSFLPREDVGQVINFAASRGITKFAALVPQSAYGAVVEKALNSSVAKNNGQLLAIERYSRSGTGLQDPVKRLSRAVKSFGVEAVLIPESGPLLKTLAPMLPYYEVDIKTTRLLGTGLWDNTAISNQEQLKGGWYAAPSPRTRSAFAARFKSAYNKEPPRLASLAYDAVSLSVALAKTPADQRFTPAQLMQKEGFAGVDGLFRFLPDGTAQRGLAVMQVATNGPQIVQKPVSRFNAYP